MDRFYRRAQTLLRAGPRALRKLSGAELTRLIDDYQALTADLARARSLGAARETVDQLNRIAVAGHNLLYGQIRLRESAAAARGFANFAGTCAGMPGPWRYRRSCFSAPPSRALSRSSFILPWLRSARR